MISFSSVSKIYAGGTEAIRNIDLHIERGEFAFLTGRSGAGKSTLLRLIALLDRASRGHVVVDGRNLDRVPRRDIPFYRRQIGMIFQEHRLLTNHSVFENVALPLRVASVRDSEIRKRVRAALDKVGLLHKERATPQTLSTGEQQRVGIARAVVNRPQILLADEPTGNLDPQLSREILALFTQFNQIGVTVVIATHDVELIEPDKRRIVLKDGAVIASRADAA